MEYVYFFRHNNSPYVKIGRTINDVKLRFSDFKVYAPLGAYIVGFIKTQDSCFLEKKIHNKYKKDRVNGEFFKLTDQDVYSEIQKNNPSFGSLIFKINELIDSYNIPEDEIIKILDRELSKKAIYNDSKKLEYLPIIDFINNNKGVDFTATEICEALNNKGYNYNPYTLGGILKRKLGYDKKSKRINETIKSYYTF